MKGFLATLKGKIILGVASVVLVTTGVVATIVLTKDDTYRTISVEEINGQITVEDAKNNSKDAYKGMHLESGDSVTVQQDANMTLLLDADKYVFADGGTKFWLEATGNSKKASTKTKIHLEEGSVLCRLDSKLGDDETYEVETPNSVMSVRGTIFRMSIFQDESGENYTRIDVLEGAVKVNLYTEDGEETGEEGIIEAGQSGLVHSNTEVSEFVIGESDISYGDYSEPMAEFIIETMDTGREICIGKNLFLHYTGLENHPEESTVKKEPTCSEEGEREIYCPTCDTIVRVEPMEKIEHIKGEWELQSEGTCIEKSVEAISCTECGEVIETRELELGEHDYGEWVTVKNATCTEEGKQEKTCKICKDVKSRNVEKIEHSFSEWSETTAPTCVASGEKARTCSMCGETETESISAKGHNYGSWNVITAATCTEEGLQKHTCNSCGASETQVIAALGHECTHTASCYHVAEGSGPYTVGGPVSVYIYLNCNRCGDEQDGLRVTGTVIEVFSDASPRFTCSCGYSSN